MVVKDWQLKKCPQRNGLFLTFAVQLSLSFYKPSGGHFLAVLCKFGNSTLRLHTLTKRKYSLLQTLSPAVAIFASSNHFLVFYEIGKLQSKRIFKVYLAQEHMSLPFLFVITPLDHEKMKPA